MTTPPPPCVQGSYTRWFKISNIGDATYRTRRIGQCNDPAPRVHDEIIAPLSTHGSTND